MGGGQERAKKSEKIDHDVYGQPPSLPIHIER